MNQNNTLWSLVLLPTMDGKGSKGVLMNRFPTERVDKRGRGVLLHSLFHSQEHKVIIKQTVRATFSALILPIERENFSLLWDYDAQVLEKQLHTPAENANRKISGWQTWGHKNGWFGSQSACKTCSLSGYMSRYAKKKRKRDADERLLQIKLLCYAWTEFTSSGSDAITSSHHLIVSGIHMSISWLPTLQREACKLLCIQKMSGDGEMEIRS